MYLHLDTSSQKPLLKDNDYSHSYCDVVHLSKVYNCMPSEHAISPVQTKHITWLFVMAVMHICRGGLEQEWLH